MSEMEHLRTVITSLERRDETSPGEMMTFGWADIACEQDGEHSLYCFVAILNYSRMRFAMFTSGTNASTLIRCLIAAFEYFGGVPRAISTYQAQSALWKLEDGVLQWHPLIADFASLLGITLQACPNTVYDDQDDGIAHRANSRIGVFNTSASLTGEKSHVFDYLNFQALARCDQFNRQTHVRTRQSPFERHPEERLTPLSSTRAWSRIGIDNALARRRRARNFARFVGRLRQFGYNLTATARAAVAQPIKPVASMAADFASGAPAWGTPAPVTRPLPTFTSIAPGWGVPAPATKPLSSYREPHAPNTPLPSPTPEQPGNEGAEEATYWESWGAARDGARIVVTPAQKYTLLIFSGTALALVSLWPQTVLTICVALMIALYTATGVHKVSLLLRGERVATDGVEDVPPARDDELPIFTVLVPLHRESRILPVLVERLDSLDYPHDRLQILLLVEMDDEETLGAARKCSLPPHISLMVMPPGQPRTKPRALNVGLREARGEYIVIYDAEDRPEQDQLRKAVAAFQALPQDVVCVQGRLNFYNWRQSLLTRLFAIDYAVWYDQLLPGLTLSGRLRSGAFVPLGGTSNHFRVETLRQVGGWDPFNVTEDCDLGARLGRAGLRVAMLDSITWEEAVPRVRPWVRQRSRWIKGYLQTYLVHMRHPLLLLRQLGLRGFVDFQMLVGANCLVVLLNPLMWALTLAYVLGRGTPVDVFIQTLFPPVLYYPALLSLVVGNFIFFYSNAYVCVRHDHMSLTRYALLTPAYWFLMSLGAWTGLISLVRNPFYWAKTEHGVSLTQTEGTLALVNQG